MILVTRSTRNMDADPLHYCGCMYDEEEIFYEDEGQSVEAVSDVEEN